jgi:hypothetical protein
MLDNNFVYFPAPQGIIPSTDYGLKINGIGSNPLIDRSAAPL